MGRTRPTHRPPRPDPLAEEHVPPREPATPQSGEGGLVRVRLDLSYDGTDFAGWAVQPGLRTVQGLLEVGLARVLRLPSVRTAVAGRTDAGVHAVGQVCHADVPAGSLTTARGRYRGSELEALGARLRGVLPSDVVVTSASLAPPGFDARFSALSRHYAYHLHDGDAGVPPLRRREVVGVRGPLDVLAMRAAGAGLVGVHDFAAYCRRREGASTVRGLRRLDVHRGPRADGSRAGEPVAELGADDGVLVAVEADAFCHSMVRALVGALVDVGQGHRDPDWPARVLRAGVRDPSLTVAPARGLVLERVVYPPPALLAQRAAQARARRDVPPAAQPGAAADDASARPWHPRGMSDTPTTSTDASTDDGDSGPAGTPVSAEPRDHDGVLEMMDVEDDRVGDALLDEGYSPAERERHVGRYGLTPDEERLGEPLDERIAQEEPDVDVLAGTALGAGSPELPADLDTDGELLDDEVGGVRAGRLVDPDQGGGPDTEKSMVGSDVGISGGAASAEEAAMHVVAAEGEDLL